MRAAIYCRVSTDGQEDNTSLASQEASCRAYAAQRSLSVVSVETDIYTGSQYRERPGLSRLRTLIRAKQVDVVICHAIDRFSRNQAHLYILLEEMRDAGVQVAFVTEVLEDSAIGRFIQSARAFAAEVEREKISERTNRGKITKLRQGIAIRPGRVKYGFVWIEDSRTYAAEPYQAEVVRRVFDEVAAQRLSARGAMRWMNAQQIPSPTGKMWVKTQVLRLLRDPMYKGEVFGMRYTGMRHGRSSVATFRKQAEWIPLPEGTAPVIVDPATWQTVQDLLDQRGSTGTATTRNAQRPALLRGLIRCQCGRPLAPESMASTAGVYRCTSRSYGPQPAACGLPSIRASAIEVWAWDLAIQSIRGERIVAIADLLHDQPDIREQRVSQLQAQARSITLQQERILSDYRRSQSIPWSLIEGEIQRAEAERQTILERIAELSVELQVTRETRSERRRLESWRATIADRLALMAFDERRQTLEAIGVRVTVHGKTPAEWEYEDDL